MFVCHVRYDESHVYENYGAIVTIVHEVMDGSFDSRRFYRTARIHYLINSIREVHLDSNHNSSHPCVQNRDYLKQNNCQLNRFYYKVALEIRLVWYYSVGGNGTCFLISSGNNSYESFCSAFNRKNCGSLRSWK
uniref:Uncharacterized protein n=1 Tax=Romanomermis culicivorax TaxID=13658 RepID=A0A915HF90_ROMCU